MPDADDLKEGKQYYTDKPQKAEGFFLKGSNNLEWGMKDRLARIFNPVSGNTVMLAFDHGYLMGPTSGLERMDLTIDIGRRNGVEISQCESAHTGTGKSLRGVAAHRTEADNGNVAGGQS